MSPTPDTTTDRIAASVTRPKVVIALLLVALASGAVLASVTLNDGPDPDRLSAHEGTMNDSENLNVLHMNVSYTGFTADYVNVTINNTDTANAHDVNVSVQVLNGSSPVTDASENNVNIAAGGTHRVDIELPANTEIFDFDIINVLVQELN
ncbi:hypothetical protein [Halococcoides cellulosivorans]|uniref:CARDB domain-containing protein n=1 Tax=Halococcoides cellulosivorans TaxID=1679096 RepID=A0A2R4X0U6_9EURY|nr:hypothetical protein [Halococcoides cellulosivorans]AWB27419.1 hypothetical protein HARCEL1_06735 [Halococcoides cellulosivorans]